MNLYDGSYENSLVLNNLNGNVENTNEDNEIDTNKLNEKDTTINKLDQVINSLNSDIDTLKYLMNDVKDEYGISDSDAENEDQVVEQTTDVTSDVNSTDVKVKFVISDYDTEDEDHVTEQINDVTSDVKSTDIVESEYTEDGMRILKIEDTNIGDEKQGNRIIECNDDEMIIIPNENLKNDATIDETINDLENQQDSDLVNSNLETKPDLLEIHEFNNIPSIVVSDPLHSNHNSEAKIHNDNQLEVVENTGNDISTSNNTNDVGPITVYSENGINIEYNAKFTGSNQIEHNFNISDEKDGMNIDLNYQDSSFKSNDDNNTFKDYQDDLNIIPKFEEQQDDQNIILNIEDKNSKLTDETAIYEYTKDGSHVLGNIDYEFSGCEDFRRELELAEKNLNDVSLILQSENEDNNLSMKISENQFNLSDSNVEKTNIIVKDNNVFIEDDANEPVFSDDLNNDIIVEMKADDNNIVGKKDDDNTIIDNKLEGLEDKYQVIEINESVEIPKTGENERPNEDLGSNVALEKSEIYKNNILEIPNNTIDN